MNKELFVLLSYIKNNQLYLINIVLYFKLRDICVIIKRILKNNVFLNKLLTL